MLKRIFITILLIAGFASVAEAIQYKGDLEVNESITFPEEFSTPGNPPAGKRKLYFKTDGNPYQLDSSGNENPILARGLKNAVINGNFDLWQRGTSFTATGYTADRWEMSPGGGDTITVSRQAFTLGQTDVPGEPTYFLRHDKTVSANANQFRYPIESVRTFAGQTVTFSGYLKIDTADTVILQIRQHFGTGGSPSGAVDSPSYSLNATTSWQKFTVTYAMPSISGKTLGTNGDDRVHLIFTMPNAVRAVDLAQVQLEKGSVATEFERRPIDLEMQLAERYFRVLGKGLAGGWDSTTEATVGTVLNPPMRTACTLTLNDTTPVVNEVSVGDKTGSSSAIAASSISTNGVWVKLNGFTGATAGNPAVTKEDAILFCDAEI